MGVAGGGGFGGAGAFHWPIMCHITRKTGRFDLASVAPSESPLSASSLHFPVSSLTPPPPPCPRCPLDLPQLPGAAAGPPAGPAPRAGRRRRRGGARRGGPDSVPPRRQRARRARRRGISKISSGRPPGPAVHGGSGPRGQRPPFRTAVSLWQIAESICRQCKTPPIRGKSAGKPP